MLVDPNTIATVAGLLGLSGKSLWDLYKNVVRRVDKDIQLSRLVALSEASRLIMEKGLGTEFSLGYYRDTDLEAAGLQRYTADIGGVRTVSSIVTRPEWVGTRVPLRGPNERCSLVSRPEGDLRADPEDVAGILADIEMRGLDVWNGTVFRPLSLDLAETTLSAQFCLDDFFKYRFTNGSLIDELGQALLDAKYDVAKVIVDRHHLTPRRERYLPSGPSLGEFQNRMCLTGVNVVCAFARPEPDGDFAIVVQRRGRKVSTRQGALSVLPAGVHQAMTCPEDEVLLSRTIMRELFEEVFGGEETEKGPARVRSDWYERASRPMRWLYKHSGAWSLMVTGAGMSLLTGGLTFSVVLVVHDEHFWVKYSHLMKTNWESAVGQSPLVSTRDAKLSELLVRPDLMDYSFQALVEGILFLRECDPRRVDPAAIVRVPKSRWLR